MGLITIFQAVKDIFATIKVFIAVLLALHFLLQVAEKPIPINDSTSSR